MPSFRQTEALGRVGAQAVCIYTCPRILQGPWAETQGDGGGRTKTAGLGAVAIGQVTDGVGGEVMLHCGLFAPNSAPSWWWCPEATGGGCFGGRWGPLSVARWLSSPKGIKASRETSFES